MMLAPDTEWFAHGTAIGTYRVIEPLGEGGMGMVYVAEHAVIGKRVAVKVLRSELGATPQLVERFFNEARVTSSIRHPGIIEVFDVGYTATGQPYIVMELLEGQSLAARLARQPKLALGEVLAIARGIASALWAAHARGVVHRDLKPDNVYLVREGDCERVKLLDFGIAKLSADPMVARTRTGLLLGTPQYMSPEQCRGASTCDCRSDLYSLGCVVFEMLSGRAPFQGDLPELLNGHLTGTPPPLEAPAGIRTLVADLLAKEPDDRPESAAVLVRELDRLADGERAHGVVMLAVPNRRVRGPLAVGLCLALAAAGAGLARLRARAMTLAPAIALPAIETGPIEVGVRGTIHEMPIAAPSDVAPRSGREVATAQRDDEVSTDLKKPHDDGVDTPVP